MGDFPRSPRVVKGGIVLMDRSSGAVQRVITLQYNPDSLTRSLQLRGAGEGGDRLSALRLSGPPVETISLEAEIDATDRLEEAGANQTGEELSIASQLAALESILYPASETLVEQNALAELGSIEIITAAAPLTLFVWSRNRVLPVRITEFGIVEESFDTELNPIRAKVTLGLRVLSINDLPFASTGGSVYMVHQQRKESLAARDSAGNLSDLGVGSIL